MGSITSTQKPCIDHPVAEGVALRRGISQRLTLDGESGPSPLEAGKENKVATRIRGFQTSPLEHRRHAEPEESKRILFEANRKYNYRIASVETKGMAKEIFTWKSIELWIESGNRLTRQFLFRWNDRGHRPPGVP